MRARVVVACSFDSRIALRLLFFIAYSRRRACHILFVCSSSQKRETLLFSRLLSLTHALISLITRPTFLSTMSSSVDSTIRGEQDDREEKVVKRDKDDTKREKNIGEEQTEQEQESEAPKLVKYFESARKCLASIDVEKYFEQNPPHPPGSPPRDRGGEGAMTTVHPDSIKKIENVVTLEETMTVRQALSTLKRYGISSAPVINSNHALFIGFQDVRDFMVLFFEKAFVSHLTRREVLQRMEELLNETVRESRRDSHPDDDARFVYRGSKKTPLLEVVRGGFLQRIDVRTHGEEICGIKPTTHRQRFTRVHRVAVYSLHFDALTRDEAMTIDAVISQTDILEFLLDYYSEKDDDPFKRISVQQAFVDEIERKEDLLALPSFTKAVDIFAALTRQNVNCVAIVDDKTGMLVDSVAANDFAYFMEEFDENLDLTIVDFMRKIRTEHIQLQSTMPPAVGVPQYESDTTTTSATDEDQKQKLQKFIVSNNVGKPNLRAAFLTSSLREVMELMRPANALLKHAHTSSERLSDVHHVFIIEEETGKPLFELTPGSVLELVALPARERVFWRVEPCELHSVYRNRKVAF